MDMEITVLPVFICFGLIQEEKESNMIAMFFKY